MQKIILASKSRARKTMLENAGIDFDCIPADIDEEKIIADLSKEDASSGNIALSLAREKAITISKNYPDKIIIGSDQVLSMNDKIYLKIESKEEARARLMEFQGQEHFLTSAVCAVKGGADLWHKTDVAGLKMKALSTQAIDEYIEIAGDDLLSCVGCYAVEGVGIRLFESIRGDFFTIMGMPLLPLLKFLDSEKALS